MTTVWIVGRVDEKTRNGLVWRFLGAYSNESAANARCRGSFHFMAPAEVDAALPEDPVDWPGCVFPRAPRGRSKVQQKVRL